VNGGGRRGRGDGDGRGRGGKNDDLFIIPPIYRYLTQHDIVLMEYIKKKVGGQVGVELKPYRKKKQSYLSIMVNGEKE